MTSMSRGVLLVLLPFIVACSPSAEPGTATVRKVVDGDTIELRIGDRNETVRLLGIDTPETVHPDEPVECFGPEASARTKELLPRGTTVRIRRDVEARDHFGRLLLYVFIDEQMINELLLREGLARPLSIAPNTTHAAKFERVADEARTANVGLWATCRQ